MIDLRKVASYGLIVLALQYPAHVLAELDLMWPEFQLPRLEWSDEIRPGLSEAQVKDKLEGMGIQYATRSGGLTYTSLVSTPQRDYLFCEDKLYALVEGDFVSGEEFIRWFQTFLSAHKQYGEPIEYVAEEDWSRFRATWKTDDGSELYFQLQSNLRDEQGWSRQLYANQTGASCLEESG